MTRTGWTAVAAVAIGVSAAALPAQVPSSGALLALSKGALTLSIVDPSTLQVVGRVPSGPDPHEVVASADGRTAYISNYNGGNNIISVVDLTAMKALASIDLGPLRAPHGLAFAGGKLWFTAEGAKAIGSYDPAAGKVDWILGTGQNRTHMIAVSADLQRIVTSNVSSATMTIVERSVGAGRGAPGGPPPGPPNRAGAPGRPGAGPAADWDETVVPVGRGAEGFDVSPDGREIWAANAQDGTVSVIDVRSRRVTQTLLANVAGANRLKFTPDGQLVLVSTLSGPDLVVLDAATRREVKRVAIGHGAAGIQLSPDGGRAFVACTPDGYVVVLDMKTLAVTGHVSVGPQPDGLAWVRRR